MLALRRFETGSDGRGGAVNPTQSTETSVALDVAARWDAPEPMAGAACVRERQVTVMFKYTTINECAREGH